MISKVLFAALKKAMSPGRVLKAGRENIETGLFFRVRKRKGRENFGQFCHFPPADKLPEAERR